MEIKEIQDLIKFVAKSGVSEVSIEQENFKITIKTGKEQTVINTTLPPAGAVLPQAQPVPEVQRPAPEKAEKAPEAAQQQNLITVKSPMIGTFYRSSSPDTPAFVNAGDEIKPGQVVCIIEAMKLFNEIESEISGRIVKILAEDASPVEYDQPLFLVEPI
ncbi:acetyl-CoA carboxylase biotin carboxyl carrier protein [Anseongella ginsenosidimutans]|uniref:Biotin carboxyl carrier protein of acetyl-CoA carboxylase n=1 Tax=Anseongella ginsenosidimutans TaxID=496056 RepID=A0A4R3KPP8_9SPHI|nr:acetyl-CoA carboxylase biotin carboxyl carrier protein [Anseongella ginsenosidimutans]QEC52176.1 acetyl-CoA carboxylase biotin carboxyl carrier protein [Anseongella ginsenosidimutans]TCS86718.1 acetyl-CoA carboxylase biotin carboxyl carrier protein [Anseongella ginsenosidimutans]